MENSMEHVHPLLHNIIQTAPRTGSTVYGGGVTAADEDVLIRPVHIDAIRAVIQEQAGQGWMTYGSITMDSPSGYPDNTVLTYRIVGTNFNLIYCKDEKTFDQWLRVTNILQRLVDTNEQFKAAMWNKKFRVGAFRALYLTATDPFMSPFV